MGDAAAAGDVDGARAVHEAIGKLLVTPTLAHASDRAVLDLDEERRKRGR